MKVEPEEILGSLERILHRSSAEQTELLFMRFTEGLTRFSRNYIHQNLVRNTRRLNIRLIRRQRIGSASTDNLTDAGIKKALEQAEEICSSQKPDKEFPGLPSSKSVLIDTKSFNEETALCNPAQRAEIISRLIHAVGKKGIEVSGAVTTKIVETVVVNSEGIRSYLLTTVAEINAILQKDDISSYAYRAGNKLNDIQIDALVNECLAKLSIGKNKTEISPGQYTVVLEPYAVAKMLGFLGYIGFGAQGFLEGRSFMSRLKGKHVAAKTITIIDDGTDRRTMRQPFDYEGIAKQRVSLIDKGFAKNVVYDYRTSKLRRGARNTGHATPAPNTYGPLPTNIIMLPGRSNLETLIRKVDEGIYVTRFHYTNVVEPVSTVITGMTRDGTYLIRKGKLVQPLLDLRFTQSILEALKNVVAIANEGMLVDSPLSYVYCPALLVKNFHFTSQTSR